MGFTAGAASNAGNVNNNSNVGQGNQSAAQDIEQLLVDSAKQFDTEAMGVATSNRAMKGGVEQQYGNTNTPQQEAQEMAQTGYIPSEQLTEEAQKKKKLLDKKAKFEEKLDMLGNLQEVIDENQVEDEHKGIIQEFFSNMNRIKNLRSRLKQLESEEEMIEEQLEQQEKDQQQQQQQQQQNDENKPQTNPFG